MRKSAAPPIPSHSVAEHNIENVEHNYQLVDSKKERAKLIKLLSSQKNICFDTETTGIDANDAELVGISFAVKPTEAFYVPIPADQTEAQSIVDEFKSVFENEKITKIGQNIKYDALILKWYNIEVKGKYFDTMLAHYLLEPELRHNMDYLAETYLKYKPVSITTLIGKKGKNQLSMRDIPVEKVTDYASEDADVTLQLRNFLAPKLKEENLQNLYDTIEEPLVNVLVEMEYNGINLNVDFLEKYGKELGDKVKNSRARNL